MTEAFTMSGHTAAADPTFDNLLKICLQREYKPSVFVKLFREFKKKSAHTKNERLDISPLYLDVDKNYLQRAYIYELLVQSDFENTFEEVINYFSAISNTIPIKDQNKVLLFINQLSKKFPWRSYARNIQVLISFANYSKYLMGKFSESEEFNRLTVQFSKILTNIFEASNNAKLNENYIQSITEFAKWLNLKSLTEAYKPLSFHLNEYTITAVKLGFNNNDQTHRQQEAADSIAAFKKKPIKINEKENFKIFKIKKIIWLSQKVTVEFINLDEQFIVAFKSLLNLSNISTVESISTLSLELLSGILQCLQLSTSNNKPIWKHYLVCKLPWFFKHILKINQNKLEKVLETVLNDDSSIILKNNEILLEFERNLVELELLRPGIVISEHTTIPANEDKFTVDELNHNYTYKFIECNPEFTSIEELGIIDFVGKVNNSIKTKHKFCELFLESLQSFMNVGDTLRLRRLLVSASINFDLLDSLLLFDSPYKFLIPLQTFLEKQVIQTPGSVTMNPAERYLNQSNQPDLMMDLDIAGDDSSNAQDFFSDLSTILVFTQFIITRYHLLLTREGLSTVPNTFSLLKNTKLISDKNNLDDIIVQEIKIDDDTVNKWISSMFDPSNVDGISDSLIKISTPLEYSQLIPKIVSEAIVCNRLGWLDDDALIGGLEYLHQKFLVGWMVYLIEEICNMKWKYKGEDNKLEIILETVLKQLLTTENKENIEIEIIIKLVREIVGEKVNSTFPSIDLNLQSVKSKKLTPTEYFANVLKFVNETDKEKQYDYEFELPQIWSTLLSKSLTVDYLYNELNILIHDEHLLADLTYELISIVLIGFAKWMVGDSISNKWPISLAQVIDSKQSSTDLQDLGLLFNRKPPLAVNVKLYKGKKSIKAEDDINKMESGFFGFIQDPKPDESDNNIMDIEEDSEKSIDIYGENLLLLAYENRGNVVTETFLREILDHLD